MESEIIEEQFLREIPTSIPSRVKALAINSLHLVVYLESELIVYRVQLNQWGNRI